jgi:hypothetical protein
MSANLEIVEQEDGTLFQAKPYIRRKVGVDFTSDRNKGISELEAQELERIEGTDELVEFRVFVNVKGWTGARPRSCCKRSRTSAKNCCSPSRTVLSLRSRWMTSNPRCGASNVTLLRKRRSVSASVLLLVKHPSLGYLLLLKTPLRRSCATQAGIEGRQSGNRFAPIDPR